MSTQVKGAAGHAAQLAGVTKSQINRSRNDQEQIPSKVPYRPGAEYYDALLWRIESRRYDSPNVSYCVGLTGCERHAGVTTAATNLAVRAAEHGLGPVLLADANIFGSPRRRPVRGEQKPGLADVLSGRAAAEVCVRTTTVASLDYLPLGSAAAANQFRVDPQQIESLMVRLRDEYSLIFWDLPAAGRFGPAVLLARALDAAVLVVRSAQATKRSAQQAVRSLTTDGVPVMGAVLTDKRMELPPWLEPML